MRILAKEAAQGALLAATTIAALSAGGDHRPLVTQAERVEAVKEDQDALLHHIGSCSIKSVEDTQEDYTDEDGNPRASLRVHVESKETPAAQQARIREKFLEGVTEHSMRVGAYARNPADPSKPYF